MICLTFDSDHLDNVRMDEWLSTLDIPGAGTLYCTELYPALRGSKFEVGPHPFLGDGINFDKQIKIYRDMFPDAQTWRSHSLVFSQVLSWQLADLGYTSVSTSERYFDKTVQPDFSPWGVWQFPIYYMDNADFDRTRRYKTFSPPIFDRSVIEQIVYGEGVYVVDMHPIHIMLNTPSFEFYASRREAFKAHDNLVGLRYSGYGVGDFFNDLLSEMRRAKIQSRTISDVQSELSKSTSYHRKPEQA